MSDTHVLLAKATVGAAGASSITFSNIPQTGYTDLIVELSGRTVTAGGNPFQGVSIKFNTDTTAANYPTRWALGLGSGTPSSGSDSSNQYFMWATNGTATASTFGNNVAYIPNYTSSNYKSFSVDVVTENNGTTALALLLAGLWQSISAINAITLTPAGDTFAANTTAYIYGISNVNTTPTIAPKASGGDIITNDGTYWYHAFLSSGTFTPQVGLTANCLVVAGGGGSGSGAGGGGGAGAVVNSASQALTTSSYTVTIGAGGSVNGSGGNNTTFGSLITAGGGGTGGNEGSNALSASGSGGGGGGPASGTTTGASAGSVSSGGTVYANAGGSGGSGGYNGGGGGGAGATGSSSGSNYGGNGGNGLNTWSAWATATSTGVSGYYAGGGGGCTFNGTASTGGSGGGGQGGRYQGGQTPTAGTVNTGSGGGGGNPSGYNGGAGGSGIVIIRYAM